MTRPGKGALSPRAGQLAKALTSILTRYEAAFGPLPLWLCELDDEAALALVASSLRIGMQLAPRETLMQDMIERRMLPATLRYKPPKGV